MNKDALLERVRGGLVVGVDGSPPSAAALRFAADLAVRTGQPLHVLQVWNLLIGPAPASSGRPATEQERQQHVDRVLTAFATETLGELRPDVHLAAVHANVDPLLEDVSAAAAHVVVGSRGRGGVADLLLGSTSAHLVDHARCPVTVVPTGR